MSQLKHDMKSAAAHAGEAASTVSENIGSALHSVESGVRDAAHRLKEVAGNAAEAIGDKFKEVGHDAHESFEHGRAQAEKWENRFEGAVRARPLTSILIAGAAGLIAGLLWKSRRRD